MSRRAAAPIVTKKHLARAERERIQRRWIVIGTIVTAVGVLGILGYGWYREAVLMPKQPVAVVNGEIITTRRFQERVRLTRLDLIGQYQRTQQLLQIFGSDPSLVSYVQQQLTQIESQMGNTSGLGLSVLNQLIDENLIRQEAAGRGITVSSDEVDEAVSEAFGFFPHGTPTPRPTSTQSPAVQTALVASPTATPEPSPSATPAATSTPGPSPTATATFAPLPTSTPYTFEAYQSDYRDYITSLKDLAVGEAAFRARFEANLYRDKLMEAWKGSVPREAEQVWARHILVADEATAREALQRLQAGESWEELAVEYSTDTATRDQGGDLGWFPRGVMYTEFEQVAFDAPVGEVSQPVETQAGWHIIQVLGREIRPLDESQFQQAVQTSFDNWLTGQRSQGTVEIQDYWLERVPVEPTLPAAGTQP